MKDENMKILMEYKEKAPICKDCVFCEAKNSDSIPDPTCHVWETLQGRGVSQVMWLPLNMQSTCKYHQFRSGEFNK